MCLAEKMQKSFRMYLFYKLPLGATVVLWSELGVSESTVYITESIFKQEDA